MKITEKEKLILSCDDFEEINTLFRQIYDEFAFCKEYWEHLPALKKYVKRTDQLLNELQNTIEIFKDHFAYLDICVLFHKFNDEHNKNVEAISEW